MEKYIPLLFIPLLWTAVSLFLSRISGWRALAEVYHSDSPFEGKRWRMQNASLRWGVNYGYCINVGVNHSGIHLCPVFLFRIGHPPLFVPWSDVSTKLEKELFVGQVVRLVFSGKTGIPFRIRKTLAHKIRTAFGTKWPGYDRLASSTN